MNAKLFTENLVNFCNACSTRDPLMRSWDKAANPVSREEEPQMTPSPSMGTWQPS